MLLNEMLSPPRWSGKHALTMGDWEKALELDSS